jgi:hypothetical protein
MESLGAFGMSSCAGLGLNELTAGPGPFFFGGISAFFI